MQLPQDLFISTADTTNGHSLCGWDRRYARPHSIALNRLEVVLNGADDPGPPTAGAKVEIVTNHPNPS